MTNQEMVDLVAASAKPRLLELLRLKVRHIFELTPGAAKSKLVVEGSAVEFKLIQTTQLYKDIERFMAEDKLAGFIVTPGVLPIVKAITMDMRGRKMLVTRKILSKPGDATHAQMDEFGVRILISFDPDLSESRLTWECLYGVA